MLILAHADHEPLPTNPFPIKVKTSQGTKHKYTPGLPGMLSVCRFQVGGDFAAAALLLRLKWRWNQKEKLHRFGREWIAESRIEWALGAGLTFHEFAKRALPRLRRHEFVKVRQMKLGKTKRLWLSLDEKLLPQPSGMEWESYVAKLSGQKFIGAEKWTGNP